MAVVNALAFSGSACLIFAISVLIKLEYLVKNLRQFWNSCSPIVGFSLTSPLGMTY